MDSTRKFLQKINPSVPKTWLQFSAGLVWFGVGLMLDGFASRWLKLVDFSFMLLLLSTGLILAAGIYSFGFSKLAIKNIQRISELAGEKVCLFAFQSWASYPLVVFMISLGVYLRVYSPFPKPMLAILYLGIGSALFAASLHYFAYIAHTLRSQFRNE